MVKTGRDQVVVVEGKEERDQEVQEVALGEQVKVTTVPTTSFIQSNTTAHQLLWSAFRTNDPEMNCLLSSLDCYCYVGRFINKQSTCCGVESSKLRALRFWLKGCCMNGVALVYTNGEYPRVEHRFDITSECSQCSR